MNIAGYFKSGSLKLCDLSDQSNDGEDYKKPKQVSLNESFCFK